jgi:hypothetical protein
MNDKGLRRQMLGITSPWIIKSVELAVAAKRLGIEVCPQEHWAGAVAMDWQEACDLGVRFLQDAIYVVHADALAVTLCDHRRELLPVGTFQQRLTAS